MHIEIRLRAGARAGLRRGLLSGLKRQFSQLADGSPRLEVLENAIEYFSLHFDQLGMNGIDLLDEDRLHPLRAVTDPRSFCLIDNQVAALQNTHSGTSERAPWIFSGHPVKVHGHLGAIAHKGILV